MSHCDVENNEIIFCVDFREALEMNLIQKSYQYPEFYLIGQYWLPLEFCPWCGNQI